MKRAAKRVAVTRTNANAVKAARLTRAATVKLESVHAVPVHASVVQQNVVNPFKHIKSS